MEKYKNCYIYVWECSFYLMDDDGNEVLNDDGTVKLFEADVDCSYVAESLELEDLEEYTDPDNARLKRDNDKLKSLLHSLAYDADEDTPFESRTKHFNKSLNDALEYLEETK